MPAAFGWEPARGIASVNKRRLDDLATGRIHTVYPQVFGRAEGMLSEECTGGFCPAGLKTRSGLLWFSTLKGVVVVNPRVLPATIPMPNTVLEEVLVDGVPDPMLHASNPKTARRNGQPGNVTSQLETLRITPGKHRVEFRYTGIELQRTGVNPLSLSSRRAGQRLGGCRDPAHGLL